MLIGFNGPMATHRSSHAFGVRLQAADKVPHQPRFPIIADRVADRAAHTLYVAPRFLIAERFMNGRGVVEPLFVASVGGLLSSFVA